MRRFPLHGIIFTSLLAAAGCNVFAARLDPAHAARGAVLGLDARAVAGARPAPGRAGLRPKSAAIPGIGIGRTPEADAPFIAPLELVDTTFAPGALLDVWLYDGDHVDLPTATSERSMGSAVVRGNFFRYNAVNSDPDLSGFWGRPLLLKWSAFLEVPDTGVYVFESELSKERGWGALTVQTMVKVNDETVFEKRARVFGSNQISESGSRSLRLAKGYHRLEVWLAVRNSLALPLNTQLGTILRIRAPGARTAGPLESSWIWHRAR